jgi:hypothetical protein
MPRRSLAKTEETPAEESRSVTRRRAAIAEDEASRPRHVAKVGRGFASSTSSSGKSDIVRFRVKDDSPVIIKFLDPAPFVNFYRHWIGKRPYVCIQTDDEDCPLCDIGDTPKLTHLINVYSVKDEELALWELTPDPAGAVEKRFVELRERGKDLASEDIYFKVNKSKKKNSDVRVYTVDIVKERDLEEDYDGLQPVSAQALREAAESRYTDKLVKKLTRAELLEVAENREE